MGRINYREAYDALRQNADDTADRLKEEVADLKSKLATAAFVLEMALKTLKGEKEE